VVGIPELVHEILLIRSPNKAIFIGTELPDLAKTCPVRCSVEQPSIVKLLLREKNPLTVGFNRYFPNVAGKGNQFVRFNPSLSAMNQSVLLSVPLISFPRVNLAKTTRPSGKISAFCVSISPKRRGSPAGSGIDRKVPAVS
jgi:hypothetical protein